MSAELLPKGLKASVHAGSAPFSGGVESAPYRVGVVITTDSHPQDKKKLPITLPVC